ncbi:MAG: HAD hydrolase family protein [Deltaproteobacteria bacterium]|nr:HAD hydrolase family protein [Deltaproteobacteria bacterium]
MTLDEKLKRVRVLVLDCDGVMTGAELIYDQHGDDQHVFNARDGHGIVLLRKVGGLKVALITGRKSTSVVKRVTELRFDHIVEMAWKKGSALRALCSENGYDLADVCYVGDDINDIGAVRIAGVGVAVADAAPELVERAAWVTKHAGGKGAVREVCEAILQAQGKWTQILADFESDGA